MEYMSSVDADITVAIDAYESDQSRGEGPAHSVSSKFSESGLTWVGAIF
jgi:hypothetical protein